MAKDMVDKIIDTTVGTAVDNVKRLVKRTKPEKKVRGGMARTHDQVVEYLMQKRGVSEGKAREFVKWTKDNDALMRGYRSSNASIWSAYKAWLEETGQMLLPERKEAKTEEPEPSDLPLLPERKEPSMEQARKKAEELAKRSEKRRARKKAEKEEKPRARKKPLPVPKPEKERGDIVIVRPPPAPRERFSPFRFSAKTFDEIKNANPKLRYKQMLKSYFNELGITEYGKLPGDFVNAIKALPFARDPTEKQLEDLRGVLDFYRTRLSKRESAKETIVKIKATEAPKKTKKVPKKRPPPVPKRGAVRKIPVVKKPPKRPTKAKKAKKTKKGKGENSSISVLI